HHDVELAEHRRFARRLVQDLLMLRCCHAVRSIKAQLRCLPRVPLNRASLALAHIPFSENRYPVPGYARSGGNGMKLVSFVVSGEERLGFLAGDAVIDPIRAGGDPRLFGSALALIKSGDAGRKAAAAMLANPPAAARLVRKEVTLTAPIRPSTLLFSGSNYLDHNAEKANAPISGKEPEFFVKPTDCVIGPNEPLFHDPAISEKIDCETELAIVIGKPGRHIAVERALDHVFGYTIVNDVTARDRHVRKSAEGTIWYDLGRGKTFDCSAPLGPRIVTADEIPDPQTLGL